MTEPGAVRSPAGRATSSSLGEARSCTWGCAALGARSNLVQPPFSPLDTLRPAAVDEL